MAADWRGWRLIVVNGERFRWRCLFGCPCGYCSAADNRVLVRAEASPSRLLTVFGAWDHLGVVFPADIAEWVEHAQACGWPGAQRTVELRLTAQPGVPSVVVG